MCVQEFMPVVIQEVLSYESLFGKKDSSFSPGGPQKTFLQRNALQPSYYRLFLSCRADPELHKEIWPVHYYNIWKHGPCTSIYMETWLVHLYIYGYMACAFFSWLVRFLFI